MRAFDRVSAGAAGRDRHIDRLAALQAHKSLFHFGLIFRGNGGGREEFRSAEIVILGTAIDEMQMIGGPGLQGNRVWREGVVGQADVDQIVRLGPS